MRKYILFLSLVVVALMTVMSCGYTTKSALPSNLRTIHIEPFKNTIDYGLSGQRKLYIPLLEVDIQNKTVDRYLFDGNLRIADADEADLILKGKLINYDRGELRTTDNDDAEEYRIYITVNIELFDTRLNENRWVEPRFTGEATYFVIGPKATSEESAIEEALEDLARRIVERTIEDW